MIVIFVDSINIDVELLDEFNKIVWCEYENK